MYQWEVIVARSLLQGAEGMTYEAPAPEMAKVKIRNEVMLDALGREFHSIAVVTMSHETRTIPIESRLTLPLEFSGQDKPRTVLVAAESRHDTKIPGMPQFYRVYLKSK